MTEQSTDPVQQKRTVRLAVQNLASPAQAQRRYAQLGWLRGTIEGFVSSSSDAAYLEGLGFTAEQVDLLQQLGQRLSDNMAADATFIDDAGSDVREYLYTSALETETWQSLRELARSCWTAIAGKESVFIALQAR